MELPAANYRLTLLATGITDGGGRPLGTDVVVSFHVLPGDANGDRVVNDLDLYLVWQNLLLPPASRDLQFDLNNDGVVSQADLDVVRADFRAVLPESAPAAAAASDTTEDESDLVAGVDLTPPKSDFWNALLASTEASIPSTSIAEAESSPVESFSSKAPPAPDRSGHRLEDPSSVNTSRELVDFLGGLLPGYLFQPMDPGEYFGAPSGRTSDVTQNAGPETLWTFDWQKASAARSPDEYELLVARTPSLVHERASFLSRTPASLRQLHNRNARPTSRDIVHV